MEDICNNKTFNIQNYKIVKNNIFLTIKNYFINKRDDSND